MATISDAAVKKATGRGWTEWFRILDRAGAKTLEHRAIVAIAATHGAGPWWGQMVTVVYERERGLREVHQTKSGFSASVSRTIAAEVDDVYEAWSKYAKKAKLKVRKATANKSMRIDPNIEIGFLPKGSGKSQVVVQASRLASKADVAKQKAHWAEILRSMKERLEAR